MTGAGPYRLVIARHVIGNCPEKAWRHCRAGRITRAMGVRRNCAVRAWTMPEPGALGPPEKIVELVVDVEELALRAFGDHVEGAGEERARRGARRLEMCLPERGRKRQVQ